MLRGREEGGSGRRVRGVIFYRVIRVGFFLGGIRLVKVRDGVRIYRRMV